MKQINSEKSVFEPMAKKQKDKANTVFLKLLSKQKSNRRDWKDLRAETLPITEEIKLGVDDEIKSIHWVTK